MIGKKYYFFLAFCLILLLIFLKGSSHNQKLPMKKLIAFGDSLTCGYQSGLTSKETPYTNYLKPLLGNDWILENKGINGEVTAQMLKRFERDVINHKPNVVVILGGTNDIGWGIDTKIIINNLKTMIQKALDAGITPIPCAIPSLIGNKRLILYRQEVNSEIAKFAKEKNLRFVNLFAATADKNLNLDRKYNNDGLHLNTDGYKLLAQVIYEQALKP